MVDEYHKEFMPVKTKNTQNPASTGKKRVGFSEDERAAMRERAKELMMDKADGEAALKEKIAAMSDVDRKMAEQLHAVVSSEAPTLQPKTWYGMPAYANKDGKVVCFFQSAAKFKARYSTLGFSDVALLDDGDFWPTSFALKKWTPAVKQAVVALLKKATR